ncbi:MAG TPA: cytochrome c [Alphaproteobacteria bacterium]|nr:cytochrome c [Alphaproteobacteria bacterium]
MRRLVLPILAVALLLLAPDAAPLAASPAAPASSAPTSSAPPSGTAASSAPAASAPAVPSAVERGHYVFLAAGCTDCHTRKGGPFLAGGRALRTEFGTYYTPNITPDPTDGIGKWSERDFMRALRDGIGPDGTHYFPVFPYPSFTFMTDADMRDLYAYLRTVPPVAEPDRPHEIAFPFNLRPLMLIWNRLFLKHGPFEPDPRASAQVNRGAYLVIALGHCAECHTPRNRLGNLDLDDWLAGTARGPEGGPEGGIVPNITPDPATGIGKWSVKDIEYLLDTGMKPDGDDVGDGMADVVDLGTSKLTASDRAAIAAYLKSVPPIRHTVRKAAGG